MSLILQLFNLVRALSKRSRILQLVNLTTMAGCLIGGIDPDSPLFEEGILWLIEISVSLISTSVNTQIYCRARGAKSIKADKEINLRKTDKGTNTVVMTKGEKLNERQIQPNVREHYRPLESPMI